MTYRRKTQCISAWAEEFNMSAITLWQRLFVLNWPIKKALTIKVRTKNY